MIPHLDIRLVATLVVASALGLSVPAVAQQRRALTGSLSADLEARTGDSMQVVMNRIASGTPSAPSQPIGTMQKSPWIAGALSAAVPGSGELYADAPLWKSLVFAAVEAAGWVTWAHFTATGDDATDAFKSYADTEWDVTRYIGWIADNYRQWSDADVDKEAIARLLPGVYTSSDPHLAPWQRVNFQQLRAIESAIGNGFSHTLPDHGDQQYYEEIGKYIQYRSGWSDHVASSDTLIYDPSFVTSDNRHYMDLRAEANRLLGYASAAIGIVVINHLASLVDAAFEAAGYNARIRARLGPAEGVEFDPKHSLGAAICLTVEF